MIGGYYKKTAESMGLKSHKNHSAYGVYEGYLMSMFEGMGTKSLFVNFALNTDQDYEKRQRVYEFIQERQKDYKIRNFTLQGTGVDIAFNDQFGTPKRVLEFAQAFTAFLRETGVPGADHCSICGEPIRFGNPRVLRTNLYYYALDEEHTSSFMGVQEQQALQRKEEDSKKSVWLGLLGGILGMVVGMIPWIIVSYIGFFAAVCGLVMGFCISKGYDWLGGRQGRAKVVLVVALTLLGTFLAEFVTQSIFIMEALTAEGFQFSLSQGLEFSWDYLFTMPENTGMFIGNFSLGLLFALLGLYTIARNLVLEHRNRKGSVEIIS